MTLYRFENNLSFGTVIDPLLNEPLKQGFSELTVITGFASGALVKHLLVEHPLLHIRLIIGMVWNSGINSSDHQIYSELMDADDRFVGYYAGQTVHAKSYVWKQPAGDQLGFVGSANFSWSGFRNNFEVITQAAPKDILDVYEMLTQNAFPINAPDIQEHIRIKSPRQTSPQEIASMHGASPEDAAVPNTIRLSLLDSSGDIHTRAGLNWGQREGRDRNQAYIPVASSVRKAHPGFLPPRGQHFLVQTDDDEVFFCVVAQDNDKAIETKEDNSILGSYFRKRIGLESGAFVTKEDLVRYGRTDVSLTKIDDDLFIMDFSRP